MILKAITKLHEKENFVNILVEKCLFRIGNFVLQFLQKFLSQFVSDAMLKGFDGFHGFCGEKSSLEFQWNMEENI